MVAVPSDFDADGVGLAVRDVFMYGVASPHEVLLPVASEAGSPRLSPSLPSTLLRCPVSTLKLVMSGGGSVVWLLDDQVRDRPVAPARVQLIDKPRTDQDMRRQGLRDVNICRSAVLAVAWCSIRHWSLLLRHWT